MKLSRKSEYVKIFENILQIIKTYDIQSSKEAQKAAHAKIYTIIDNIKAKNWSEFAPKKKEQVYKSEKSENYTEREQTLYKSNTSGITNRKIEPYSK